MHSILLTGATGLAGSHILRHLLLNGYNVWALGVSPAQLTALQNRWDRHFPEQADLLRNVNCLNERLEDISSMPCPDASIQTFVHAAGLVSFEPSDRFRLHRINALGTADCVNASLSWGVKRFVHISSVATLTPPGVRTGPTPPFPKAGSPYAQSKYLADLEVQRGLVEGLETLTLHPSIILGIHDWNKGSNQMIRRAAEGIRFYTSGANGFVGAEDLGKIVAQAEQAALTGAFVVSSKSWKYRRLFDVLLQHFGHSPAPFHAGPFLSGVYWRLEWMRSKIMGKSPLVTRYSAQSAQTERNWDGTPLLKLLPGFSYETLESLLKRLAAAYTLDLSR